MIHERYADLSHGTSRYLEAGEGTPVILLHGVDEALNLDDVPDASKREEWVRDRTGGGGVDIVLRVRGIARDRRSAESGPARWPDGHCRRHGQDDHAAGRRIHRQVRGHLGVVMAEGRHFYEAVNFLATRRAQFGFERIITGTYALGQVTEALQAIADFREVKPRCDPGVNRIPYHAQNIAIWLVSQENI